MAGRARLQALKDELEARTLATFEGWETHEPATHLDYVCYRVENGTTTKDIAIELEKALGFELSYSSLMRYLAREYGEERSASSIDSARARASHRLVDDAIGIVDEEQKDGVGVQRARARASQRNWMAERYNPSKYGQQKQTNVSISVTALHLDALRARPTQVTSGPVAVVEASQVTAALPSQAVVGTALSSE